MEAVYFSTAEAAEYLGLSESYLAKLRMGTLAEPGPRYLRVGQRAIRYRRTDLDSWMDSKSSDGNFQNVGSC
ncbi:Helix-turn-helix domain protein [Roseovarius albus]|uniref:Helix-turn-helix domain protein n=1 Tax=Roseovarius albus TaxID=1247867 RepID=A0A1X7A4T2_9RHOB|nr:Helix-turn-helix domain protein [Roseovarius albus]